MSDKYSQDLSFESFDENDEKKNIKINTVKCKGELKLLRSIIDKNNWKEVFDESAHIFWSSISLPIEDYKIALRSNKYLSRIPGISEISLKKITGDILNKYLSYYPDDYNFFPKTFLLPEQLGLFKSYFNSTTDEIFIAKPTNGFQGDGIILIHSLTDLPNFDFLKKTNNKYQEYVVQKYIDNPLLIEKKKFDLRLYVLISSVEPFICYLNEEGLARFCTQEYKAPNKKNMRNTFMHLSNYSLNKNSDFYKHSDEVVEISDGTKRSLTSFWKSCENAGYKKEEILGPAENLIKKFMIAIYPFLLLSYNNIFSGRDLNCFHVIGVDILYDEDLNPFILEINSNPSLSISAPTPHYGKLTDEKSNISVIDLFVKEKAIEDAIKIVVNPIDKQMEIGIGNWYYSYKQLINFEIEPREDDLFMKIKLLYSTITSTSKEKVINVNKFLKISTLLNIVNDKVTKADYFLIFQKVNLGNTKTSINIYKFISALELVAEKVYEINEDNKLDGMLQLVETLQNLVDS